VEIIYKDVHVAQNLVPLKLIEALSFLAVVNDIGLSIERQDFGNIPQEELSPVPAT